jgi:hypothetical protein
MNYENHHHCVYCNDDDGEHVNVRKTNDDGRVVWFHPECYASWLKFCREHFLLEE